MIGADILKPGSFQHHLVASDHKKAHTKRTLLVSLSLTAMVDMFAVLVIFLLQSFSSSPEVIITKGIELPEAVSGSEMKDAPFLSLAKGQLFLNQELLGSVGDVLKKPNKLMVRLKTARQKWQKDHPEKNFPGEIHFQADRSIPSTTIGNIMGVVSQAHYYSIQLAVLSRDSQ
ncbi:MAG: biopolymer transporter ExbD [Bacteriovoracales bacterium]|nr:biopolymer transporter ExbD [Bacteriovoracales bacterium]